MTIKVVEVYYDGATKEKRELFELDYIPRENELFEIDNHMFYIQQIINKKPLFGERQVLVIVSKMR